MCLFCENRRSKSKVSLLVSTTGDTGPAAICAAGGLSSLQLVVTYPLGQISRVQELQMTTQVCVCVCVCVCVLCVYMYVYIHTYIYTYVHIYICIYMHIYMYTYIFIHIYIYIYTCTYTNTDVRTCF